MTDLLTIESIHEFLKQSVVDVFKTMLNITSEPLTESVQKTPERLIIGSVGFTGDVTGVVYIYIEEGFSKSLAARILGFSEQEIDNDEIVDDVIGEISNMVVGTTKSKICDSGALCVLTIPTIIRGSNLKTTHSTKSTARVFSMQCEESTIHIELIMKAQSSGVLFK